MVLDAEGLKPIIAEPKKYILRAIKHEARAS